MAPAQMPVPTSPIAASTHVAAIWNTIDSIPTTTIHPPQLPAELAEKPGFASVDIRVTLSVLLPSLAGLPIVCQQFKLWLQVLD